jgi:CHASE3 domain sensor protein
MYRLTVRRKGALIIAVSVIFNFALLIGLILMQRENQHAADDSEHSMQVLAAGRQLLSELVNAETGMRGYIISRNPQFLEPYNFAINDVPMTRQRLEELCRDNPQQLKIAQQLHASITDFLQYHASNRRLIEHSRFVEVAEHTRRAEGKRRMDALRIEVQQLLDVQNKVDEATRQASLNSRSQMRWLLYVGLLLNLAVAGVIHKFLTSSITGRIATLPKTIEWPQKASLWDRL